MTSIKEMSDEELKEHLYSFKLLLEDCEFNIRKFENEIFYRKHPEVRPKE